MIEIKKNIYFVLKIIISLITFFTLILFFYSAFFYKSTSIKKTEVQKQIEEEKVEPEVIKEVEEKKVAKIEAKKTEIKKIKTEIKDGLYATVGNKVITKSDILNEIKVILILNNMSFSEEKKAKLQEMAVKSAVKRTVKEIEIDKQKLLEFSQDDLENELLRIASRINVDVATLKNICKSNELDFSIIENQIKTELLWNSLIFLTYRDKLSINIDEINEQLKVNQNKKVFEEYLLSEILLEPVSEDKIETLIKQIKNKIEAEGFKNVAMNYSISKSAVNGGDIGWVNESKIAKKFRTAISKTAIGEISEPLIIKQGILIFNVRNKKIIEKKIDLEELKNQLVNSEKNKILNMYSMSHYDNLRRSISIKYFN